MKEKSSNNNSIKIVSYAFIILFAAMIIWLFYLVVFQKKNIENNSYNKRIDLWEKNTWRGDIVARDGEVLALTVDNGESLGREYPYGEIFAHVVGFNTNGKSGIENLMNYYLLSSGDSELEKVMNEMTEKRSIGYNCITTLDVDLQKAAYEALGNCNGACVALDASTGEVLCMVSKPSFNPGSIAREWDNIVADESNTCLINRATAGLYPPGSTFKTITLLEYIRENNDYADYNYLCEGTVNVKGSVLSCIYHQAHGNVNLNRAFAYSCNCAFSTIGLTLEQAKLRETCDMLMFNKELFTSFECSESSFVLDEKSSTFDIMQTTMGQGQTLITPMHNAMIAASIANDGVLMKPYLVSKIESPSGKTVKTFGSEKLNLMKPDEAKIITGYMKDVVEFGTATELNNRGYDAYGKTGSAQYTNENLDAFHSWFIGFAKSGDRVIALAAIVEDSQNNNNTGKMVARSVFDTYFAR